MFFEQDPGYFVRAMKYGDPYFGDYLKQTGASVILDRGYPSEWVYSQAFGRQTDVGMLRLIDDMYAALGLKVISPFRSDYSRVEDQFDAIDHHKLNEIHDLYAQFCQWTKCDVLRFCVDDEDLEKQMGLIVPFVGGRVLEFNDAGFDEDVLKSDVPVLVDFWAPWCAPCRALTPTLERLAKEFHGQLRVGKLNIDENPVVTVRFSVMSVPTLVVFKGGVARSSVVGAVPEARVRELIGSVLSG